MHVQLSGATQVPFKHLLEVQIGVSQDGPLHPFEQEHTSGKIHVPLPLQSFKLSQLTMEHFGPLYPLSHKQVFVSTQVPLPQGLLSLPQACGSKVTHPVTFVLQKGKQVQTPLVQLPFPLHIPFPGQVGGVKKKVTESVVHVTPASNEIAIEFDP